MNVKMFKYREEFYIEGKICFKGMWDEDKWNWDVRF